MRWTNFSVFRTGHKTLNLKSILEFNGCQSGVIAPMTALIISSILVLGGLGIDYANAINVRSKLQVAVDSAVSAARASVLETDAELNDIIANSINSHAAANITNPVSSDIAIQSDAVSVTSSTVVATMFSQLIGFKQFEVSVSSTAKRPTIGSEIVRAPDGFGSKGGGSSLRDAKAASAEILDQLDCLSTDDDSIVMSSQTAQRLNIGHFKERACFELQRRLTSINGMSKGDPTQIDGSMRRAMEKFQKLQMR